jgi:hypothetical protein
MNACAAGEFRHQRDLWPGAQTSATAEPACCGDIDSTMAQQVVLKSRTASPGRTRPAAGRRRPARAPPGAAQLSAGARRCRAKFLRYFPKGFQDPLYVDWERGYKWDAHKRWQAALDEATLRRLLKAGNHAQIAAHAVAIEARTNLLFSFEKMALRDAVRSPAGARAFAHGLYDFLHGHDDIETRFSRWCDVVGTLPRRQTRVLTWPVVTVLGFIAQPQTHIFLKPTVTRIAAQRYGFPFAYAPRPAWGTYASLLALARTVRRDQSQLRPREMIDIQSFLWVQGSDEYPS